MEALAAARHFDAEICLAAVDGNPPLVSASGAAGVAVRVLAT